MKLILGVVTLSLVLTACAGERPVPPGGGGIDTAPLRFVLQDPFRVGQRVDVRLENLSADTFVYNSYYQACEMTYRDASGRDFLIPPGTHCDLVAMADLGPGETATLFTWKLEECVKDDWGCVKARTLPPGTYTIEGEFERKDGGKAATVSGTFEIVEA